MPSEWNHRTTRTVSLAMSLPMTVTTTDAAGAIVLGELTLSRERPEMLTVTPLSTSWLVFTSR